MKVLNQTWWFFSVLSSAVVISEWVHLNTSCILLSYRITACWWNKRHHSHWQEHRRFIADDNPPPAHSSAHTCTVLVRSYSLQLLLKPKFSNIEKIKTIGSTYMIASGLRRSARRQNVRRASSSSNHVATVVDMARLMMDVVATLNHSSFTQFSLRIGETRITNKQQWRHQLNVRFLGINHGPVVAGVIGSQKPQYDIWGDTVNVASRMETTGVNYHIHVRV